MCRNPRVHKEATALSEAGFDVAVSSIVNIERFEVFERELLRGARFRRIVIDRISRRPFDRLVALAERALTWLACRAVPLGIESPLALGPYFALRRLALRTPADLTIVHTELSFVVGAHLIARGRRVAADFEDWHSHDLLPASRSGRPLRLLEETERLLLNRSAYTSAPSGSMAAALRDAYGGALPLVIPNTFPLQPASPPLPRQAPPAFFWFSQTIGEGRGIEPFLAGWALTREPSQVCLLGDISDGFRATLLGLVPQEKHPWLRFLPITSPTDLPAVIAEHDIGLSLEAQSPESRYLTTTNKIFQYLNAGLAVVATPTAGQTEVMSKIPDSGIIVELGSPVALAAQLDELLAAPGRLASMGAAAREGAVKYFCWEHSAPLLVAAVRDAVRGAGPKARAPGI